MSSFTNMNFHTHSTFCDGKNTLEENVSAAIEKGFRILGFSSHSVFPHNADCNMKTSSFESYCSTIRTLKEKYQEKIDIRLGFEADYIPGFCKPDFAVYRQFNPDFLIGSVHFLYNGEDSIDKMMAVDNTPEIFMEALAKFYHNDIKEMTGHYFSSQRKMLEEGNFSIIGHPDLIRKFNDRLQVLDEGESWYKNELKETAKAIKKAGVISEINTGAISRGWLKQPYPSEYFLELLYQEGVPVMINSDAHAALNLDCAFDQALALVKKVGYTELCWPENGSIKTTGI